MALTYVDAKNRLMQINRKEREARILLRKVESMQRFLENNSTSVIVMNSNQGSKRERTEIVAEYMDLKDQFNYLLKEIELARLELIHEIESLENDEHVYYLKMRFVYGLGYQQIAYQEHYNVYWVQKKIIAATKYYAENIQLIA